ncbi:MAG: hypothetical protein Ct9H300mP1_08610 [Planctomycetaceae bacterium]|nr:MAG: hypothetical protein Ct9H300mP1_08610 [Planctomycetaceae bacterium]
MSTSVLARRTGVAACCCHVAWSSTVHGFFQMQATFPLEEGERSDQQLGRPQRQRRHLQGLPRADAGFDQAVPALINDLYDRGLNEKVLFIFCGEFGRTPKIRHQDKATKRPGRDHWARSMSIFLSGGGLKMGRSSVRPTRGVRILYGG